LSQLNDYADRDFFPKGYEHAPAYVIDRDVGSAVIEQSRQRDVERDSQDNHDGRDRIAGWREMLELILKFFGNQLIG
jgi:hypothetical protein